MVCPRRGYAWLRTIVGQTFVIPTNCRQWDCLPCRDRNLTAVRLRAQFGCLMGKPTFFITITYKSGGGSILRRNDTSGRDLAKLWSTFSGKYRKTPSHPKLAWFKVPELTKIGQVHFHLLVTGIETPVAAACQREPDYGGAWRRRTCLCLEHQLSALWHEITGDSWVVDVRPVLSSKDDASYVTKYVTKGMAHRRQMVRRGFARRWACSRNWPRPELHLRGTVEGKWYAQGMEKPNPVSQAAAETSRGHRYLDRVGTPEAMAFDKRLRMKTLLRQLEGNIDHLHTAPNVPIRHRIGH